MNNEPKKTTPAAQPKPADPKTQATELPDENLDTVAGGATYSTSRSNVRASK